MNALEDVMLRILIIVAVCSMALGIFENGWLKVKITSFFSFRKLLRKIIPTFSLFLLNDRVR